MEEKILDFLQKHQILDSQKTYAVGFSGGQDSLCLIDILDKLSKEHNFKIIALHLNHNWRGEESNREQCSCLEFCKKRGIEFYTKTLDTSVKKTEEEARKARYEFFKETCLKTRADGVFTAHTKTDNTETILYRIIKGTGIHGLCAIPEIRDEDGMKILRPMLEITRAETGLYCQEHGLVPSLDSSNLDDKYARNNLRLNIIPLLQEINPNLDYALENLSNIASDYEKILSDVIAEKPFTPKVFATLSDAEKKAYIHRFLMQNNIDYSSKKITEIKEFLEENIKKPCGNTISAGTDKWIFASKDKIEIISKPSKTTETIELKINQDNFFEPLNKILSIKEYKGEKPSKFPKETDFKAYVNLPKNLTPLELRTRREGDIIQPFGMDGTMKLKKFFINRGIAEHKRDEILLVAYKNEVLWAIGVGLSEKLKASKKPTHIIELR
jgi:tRNA(Ile)-lysidine synthase